MAPKGCVNAAYVLKSASRPAGYSAAGSLPQTPRFLLGVEYCDGINVLCFNDDVFRWQEQNKNTGLDWQSQIINLKFM